MAARARRRSRPEWRIRLQIVYLRHNRQQKGGVAPHESQGPSKRQGCCLQNGGVLRAARRGRAFALLDRAFAPAGPSAFAPEIDHLRPNGRVRIEWARCCFTRRGQPGIVNALGLLKATGSTRAPTTASTTNSALYRPSHGHAPPHEYTLSPHGWGSVPSAQ